MSELKVSPEFRQQFLDASRLWLLYGYTETEIDEIKEDTRQVLKEGGERAIGWQAWVVEAAEEMNSLEAAKNINERVRAAIKEQV